MANEEQLAILRSGVDAWNEWRKIFHEDMIHLEGADLEGVRLERVDFEGALLQGACLDGANLQDACLNGANLFGASLVEANLRSARLKNANLMNANLKDADFGDACLSKSNLINARFDGAVFGFARLDGAKMSGARLEGHYLRGVHFENADLQGAHLEGADLAQAHLVNANLLGAHLEGADLTQADLRDADIALVTFHTPHVMNATVWQSDIKLASDIWTKHVAKDPASRRNYKHLFLRLWSVFAERTRFQGIRIETAHGSERFKRHAKDQAFLEEYRSQGLWKYFVYVLWRVTSDCGRSLTRWALLSLVLAIAFGGLFWWLGDAHIHVNNPEDTRMVTSWTYIYYSVVTFTTLGFGDVTPTTPLGELLVMVEVIIGYVMLGGLLSILANKFARRS